LTYSHKKANLSIGNLKKLPLIAVNNGKDFSLIVKGKSKQT